MIAHSGEILFSLTVGFFLWCALFSLVRYYFSAASREYASRIVSLMHSVIICILSWNAWSLQIEPLPGGETSDSQVVALLFSASYFVYDGVVSYVYGFSECHFLIHHVVSAVALLDSVFFWDVGMGAEYGTFANGSLQSFLSHNVDFSPRQKASDMGQLGM